MNREQTLEAIKVMQHFADGGEVEFCNQDMWCCAGSPTWELNRLKYRIKPKPLECWVVVDTEGDLSKAFATEEAARRWVLNTFGCRWSTSIRHMREVTE